MEKELREMQDAMAKLHIRFEELECEDSGASGDKGKKGFDFGSVKRDRSTSPVEALVDTNLNRSAPDKLRYIHHSFLVCMIHCMYD